MTIFQIILLYLIIGTIIALILNKDHFLENEIYRKAKKEILKPTKKGWKIGHEEYCKLITDDEKEVYIQYVSKACIILSFIICIVGWIYIILKSFIYVMVHRHKVKIGIQNALETFEKVKETYDDYDYDRFHYYMQHNGIEYDYEHHGYSSTKKDLYYAMKYVEECRKYKEESK